MRKALAISASLAAFGLFAGPTPSIDADSVAWRMDAHSRLVTIDYELSEADAIVTFDVLTNGVCASASLTANAAGDVFQRVAPGVRKIFWRPGDLFETGGFDAAEVTFRVNAWTLDHPPAYLVVDIATDSVQRVRYAVSEEGLPYGGVTSDVYRTSKIALRLIPAAGNTWTMGTTPNGNPNLSTREVPRIVTMTNDYYLGIFPVTQAQHLLVTGKKPGTAANGLFSPVNNLAFTTIRGHQEAADWPSCGHEVSTTSAIGLLRSRTGVDFDLPTSAQWEYACRAGAGTKYFWGSDFSDVYADSSGIWPVGRKKPNLFGLYDLISMPWEWCLDWVGGLGKAGDCVTEPVGPDKCPSDDYSDGKPRRVGRGNYCAKINPQVHDITMGNSYGYRLMCPVTLAW